MDSAHNAAEARPAMRHFVGASGGGITPCGHNEAQRIPLLGKIA